MLLRRGEKRGGIYGGVLKGKRPLRVNRKIRDREDFEIMDIMRENI